MGESLFKLIASVGVVAIFVAMDWPIYIIHTTIFLSSFISLAIFAYRMYVNPGATIIIGMTIINQFQDILEKLMNIMNRSVSVSSSTNITTITVHNNLSKDRYYIRTMPPIEHLVMGIDKAGNETDITAAPGTDYQFTANDLGYEEFRVKVGDSVTRIGKCEVLTLEAIKQKEDDGLYVD